MGGGSRGGRLTLILSVGEEVEINFCLVRGGGGGGGAT